ncbi:MAG: FAD-dependent thymidylate synthase [Candidatus Nanoarchaeia archaeon]
MQTPVVKKTKSNFPYIESPVYHTAKGTPYLRGPGVVLISMPAVDIRGMENFLGGFNKDLGFEEYLEDPDELPPPEQLCKTAGQLCYMSFGLKRTKNSEAQKYLNHLKESGHGSVFEHANFSFLLYGISRSLTHELVRHRAGTAYSQVSQRYVSSEVLRFVERPEYQQDENLHKEFEARIDNVTSKFNSLCEILSNQQERGDTIFNANAKTDLRKKIQQCARSILPNETEAPIIMTANARAWRHIIETRTSASTDIEIRILFYRVYLCLKEVTPRLFSDYTPIELQDGTISLYTKWSKI